jgi:hypothetical protein
VPLTNYPKIKLKKAILFAIATKKYLWGWSGSLEIEHLTGLVFDPQPCQRKKERKKKENTRSKFNQRGEKSLQRKLLGINGRN